MVKVANICEREDTCHWLAPDFDTVDVVSKMLMFLAKLILVWFRIDHCPSQFELKSSCTSTTYPRWQYFFQSWPLFYLFSQLTHCAMWDNLFRRTFDATILRSYNCPTSYKDIQRHPPFSNTLIFCLEVNFPERRFCRRSVRHRDRKVRCFSGVTLQPSILRCFNFTFICRQSFSNITRHHMPPTLNSISLSFCRRWNQLFSVISVLI